MKRTLIFLAGISSLATASTDYTADSRKLSAAALCGATNISCQQAYISGAKDGTAAFKRVLVTYKAIRAAEVPTPPPAPPPSPPPPPTASGVTSEGDSISVLWGGNHVGIWSSSRPDVPLKSLAVGGSGLNDLIARKANIGTPKVFTVLIGANDLTSYSSGKAYADAVIAYIGPVRAAGAKVAVGTILPQVSTNSAYQLKFDAYRAEYNASIKASGAIDAVIDFGAPQLQADGVHPTDAGQAAMAPAYKAVVDALLAGETVPPPPPPPPPSGEVLYPIAPIPSNFDVASELVPAWGTGAIPPSAAPDVVGAFRFICNASHLAYDDPIVYPGQAGKSHLHQFYGNTGANANSTFASLRTSGNSTCNSPLNRSAYWMPAFLDGLGNVVIPDYVQVYYKRRMKSDPRCTLGNANAEGDCVNLPNGLRFIFGYDMATMTKGNGAPYFDCQGPTATPGHYYANQNGLATVATKCGPGNLLGAVIAGPDCWDGVHLDVPDHRSHMAYKVRNVATGQMACPATHPKVIPQFTISAWYKVEPVAGVQYPVQNWSLSSDAMPGMTMAQGSTLHFDYFEGWDEGVKKAWHDACIDGLKNASGGDLCDGRQLKMFAGFKWAASPNRVPIPPHM